jgi:PDZ domain-containing protein
VIPATDVRPTEPPPPDDAGPGGPSGRWHRFVVLVPILALAWILYFVPIPYFVISPGPAQDVIPLIHIEDRTVYATDGHLLLTAVNLQQPNVYEALWGWLDSTQAVLPEGDILAPGETQQQEVRRQLSEMDTSKIDAAYVALQAYANYPAQHGKGVLIESVLPGTPAEGRLFAGDLIESVDGKPIDTPDELGVLIRAAGVAKSVSIRIKAGGETHDVSVRPVRVKGIAYPVIGVSAVENFPFPLTIDSGNIGGPSAGLMWTLGLADLLTPGDLTGRKTIAGTGTIDLEGTVGPIGGIAEKVIAAERAGAKVFFAPTQDAPEARRAADHIVIVAVATFTDAIKYLQQHP